MMYRPASSHIFFEDSRSASQERVGNATGLKEPS